MISGVRNRDIVLAGDFNAHSLHWGSSTTSPKGELLEAWTASLDLWLANIGDAPTCVRWQGSSVVDLTWVSPGLVGRVVDWRVRVDFESLSDHQYISFSILNQPMPPRGRVYSPRWNLKKLDRELLLESILWSCSVGPSPEESFDLNPGLWIDRVLREACDASAPRVYVTKYRRNVYWWSDAIEELRKSAVRSRRRFHRARRGQDDDEINSAWLLYKRCKSDLNKEIARAKEGAWRDLLALVEEDLWGFPYRASVKRLTSSSNLTQVLEAEVLKKVLDSLFPLGEALLIQWERDRGFIWNDEWAVTPEEGGFAIKGKRRVNTAPGPDGISAAILKQMPGVLIERLADCFSACLRRDCFPEQWKVAGLVLIPKGDPAVAPAGDIPRGQAHLPIKRSGESF